MSHLWDTGEEVRRMYMCQKVIAAVWIIAIVMVPIVRAIGAWIWEEDGDIFCYFYMVYALVVCGVFTALEVYVGKVLS